MKTGISFDDVARAASSMLSQGINPTVRGILGVTGGKTETVSAHLRDFFDKRDAEVLKMADELGSSAIAKLIAGEIQNVVDRKTENLQHVLKQQKSQINELIELLDEKEFECNHRVDLAESKSALALNDCKDKLKVAADRADRAEQNANEIKISADETQRKADARVDANEEKCTLLIENAKNEANSLVAAANKRADRAEQEASSLREQVTQLTVDQAKHELAKHELEAARVQLTKISSELADTRTQNAKLETGIEHLRIDNERLSNELFDTRLDSKKVGELNGQMLELQKQLSQSQHNLLQSERERESLTFALKNNAQNNKAQKSKEAEKVNVTMRIHVVSNYDMTNEECEQFASGVESTVGTGGKIKALRHQFKFTSEKLPNNTRGVVKMTRNGGGKDPEFMFDTTTLA